MEVKSLTPILNVTNIVDSFNWFETFGWTKNFEWGDPVGFGAVCSGEAQIFMCEGAQGGKGKGSNTRTFNSDGGEAADKGVWMSIFVDNVDEIHQQCKQNQLDIVFGPEDMPWGVREMHVRHPDGHVFRVGTAIANNA